MIHCFHATFPKDLNSEGNLLPFLRSLFMCLIITTVPSAAADHPYGIKVIGFPKEGRLETNGTGPYANLVRAIMAEAGYGDTMITVPVLRAMRYFETEGEVCLVPTSKLAVSMQFPTIPPEKLTESQPIDYVSGHLVTRAGTAPISTAAEIKGKTMAAWVGVNAKVFFPETDFTLLKTETEVSAIRLLHSGRVDVIWSWIPDVYILYDQLGLGEPVLAKDKPIFGSSAHFSCHLTPRTADFIANIDVVIEQMRGDGRLKKILGKYARIVGVDVPMPARFKEP